MRKFLFGLIWTICVVAVVFGLVLLVDRARIAKAYIIERGDTLTALAERFGTTVDALREENGLLNPDLIFAGAELSLPKEEIKFGSSGIYDKYAPTVADAGISSTDTFLPLSTFTLSTDDTITTSTIHFPVYLVINPDSSTSREQIECNAMDTTLKRFNLCYRAITCNNLTNSTSTVSGGAYAHSAGERVIMSNTGCYFNRYVDNFTTQTVGGTKTFTTSTVSIGDNATTTEKSLIYRVGLGNNTYLKFRGPAAGYTTATALLNLGAGEFELNASGTTAGASSTASIGLTGGLFYWKVSSTQGLNSDNTNGDGSAVILASSTASDNGGFLNFVTSTNALGRLFWDVRSFLAKAWTWTGVQTFSGSVTLNGTSNVINGNTTTTGTFTVNVPTSSRDAANREFVESIVTFGSATATAGFDLNVGQAIYISTTSTAFPTSSSVASSTFAFIGIVLKQASSTATVTYARPGETVCNQSALTQGYNYYLNGTLGQMAATPGTKFARIGRAISASCIQILDPKYIERGTLTVSSATTYSVVTGFYPAHITITAGSAGVGGQTAGMSVGDDTNNCVLYSGVSGSAGYTTQAWRTVNSAGTTNAGTVSSKNETGFILTAATVGGNADLFWVAFSE